MAYITELKYNQDGVPSAKYIVTGGAGFIGSHLVDALIDNGNEVIILDNLSTGKEENINPKAEFHKVDISSSPMNYQNLFEGVDAVFHLAAKARVQPSIEDPLSFHHANMTGLLNMLECSRQHNVRRFVFSSSSSVYGDTEKFPTSEDAPLKPMSPYALQKLHGEQYCKMYNELYGIETVCLRYFNVYGERQSIEGAYTLVMGVFAQQRLSGKPMTIRGDGEQRRDFTYVHDVVHANIEAGLRREQYRFMGLAIPFSGNVFNVGAGDNRSVNEIAELIGGDRINVEAVLEPRQTMADNKKIREVLNWKPTMTVEEWIPRWKEELGL